jgi:Tol biopolymer transport system component
MNKRVFLLIAFLLTACDGTLEVGIERTATPDLSPAATMQALKGENSLLATRVASMITPTPATPPQLGQIAYVQGGDIWIKALPRGMPQRLTTDGRNHDPRWSPSGQWLAFRKDQEQTIEQEVACETPRPRTQVCYDVQTIVQKQVWVIQTDGTGAHPLHQGASVEAFAWSPTDDRLAYVTTATGLSTINADGTELVTLVAAGLADSSNMGRPRRFAWSPDGLAIAYEWRILSSDQTPTYEGLWKVSVASRERTELYTSGLPQKGEAILAGWSPQGRRVLFWQSETPFASLADGAPLYSVRADTPSSPTPPPLQLESAGMLNYADFIATAPPHLTSSLQDAVAVIEGTNRSTWKNKRIELAGLDLTPNNLAAISLAWAPNGARLAFSGMADRADLSGDLVRQELMQRRIWIFNLQGEPQLQRLTDTTSYREERPRWSADSSHILFARLDVRGRASLWIVDVEGGSPLQVVDELTPAPDSIGSYGHIEWDYWFDWWRG